MSGQGTWQPIETAPKDGRLIRVRYGWDDNAEEDGVYYAETRQCMLGARAGECGEGWVSTEVGHLPVEPTEWLSEKSPYEILHTAARPYAERDVAANPLRDNYPPGEWEHEIRLTQAAYASTAVTQGRTIAEIAARHEGGRGRRVG